MALTKITTEVIEDGAITSAKLGSGSVSAASLSSITTDNVSEGSTNVYYTDTRARGSVSVTGGNLSYDSGTGVIQLTTDTIRGAISVTDAGGDGSLAYSAGVITYTGPSAAETRAHFSGSTGISYNSSTGAFTTSAIPNASLSNSSITINSNSVDLGASVTLDTDDVGEGSTNLYYTDARVDSRLASGNVGNILTTGYIAGPATFTIDPAAVGDNTGTVVIAGNLQVDGTTTTINSTTMEVDDLNITLASGAANAAAANGAGITVDCGSDTDATFTYDGTNDEWDFNKNINVEGTSSFGVVNSSGNVRAGNGTTTGNVQFTSSSYQISGGSAVGDLRFVAPRFRFYEDAATGTADFSIDNGNVAIGVANAARGPLHVHEEGTTDGQIHLTNANTGSAATDGLTIFADTDLQGIWSRENCDFVIASAATEAFRLTTSQNAIFAGTISSGAITATGNLHAGEGTNISMDASANGQIEADGDGYQGAIALDGSAMHLYHNSSSRDLVLGTNETARLTISGTGGFNFESNPVQGITTLSSGALTVTSNSDSIFRNSTDNDNLVKLETNQSSDFAAVRVNGNNGGDQKYLIGYGSTHASQANELSLKNTNTSGVLSFYSGGANRNLVLDTAGNLLQRTGYHLIGTDSGDAFNSNSVIRIQDSGNAYIQIKAGTSASGGVLIGDTGDDYVGGFIYNNSTNSLVITSGNNTALTLDSTQDGTFANKLTITGSTSYEDALRTTNGRIQLGPHTSGAGLWLDRGDLAQRWFIGLNSQNSDTFRLWRGGNKWTLDASGNTTQTGECSAASFSSNVHQVTSSPSTAGQGDLSLGSDGTYSYIQSHNSQILRINPVGNNVQIGNDSSPWFFFSSSQAILKTGSDLVLGTSAMDTSTGSIHIPRGGHITFYGNSNVDHSIGSRNQDGSITDDLRISSYGSVYIDLDSNNNNSSTADFVIGKHGSGDGSLDEIFRINGEGNGPGAIITQGENHEFRYGNAGIYFTNGSSNPSFANHGGIGRSAGTNFHVSGSTAGDLCICADSGKHIMFGDANTQNARLEDNGNFIAAGSVTGSSDERLKDNVQTIENALEKTISLRGVTFTRNDIENSPEKIGVIAQEVEPILPQVVVTAEDEDAYKSVAYGEMVALLIEAIKELKTENDSLKTRIEALEG